MVRYLRKYDGDLIYNVFKLKARETMVIYLRKYDGDLIYNVFKYFNRGAENDALLMYMGSEVRSRADTATSQPCSSVCLSTRQTVAHTPSCLNYTIVPETAKRAIK
jgi:hypothetical protein